MLSYDTFENQCLLLSVMIFICKCGSECDSRASVKGKCPVCTHTVNKCSCDISQYCPFSVYFSKKKKKMQKATG